MGFDLFVIFCYNFGKKRINDDGSIDKAIKTQGQGLR